MSSFVVLSEYLLTFGGQKIVFFFFTTGNDQEKLMFITNINLLQYVTSFDIFRKLSQRSLDASVTLYANAI